MCEQESNQENNPEMILELQELRERVKRISADYINFQRRVTEEGERRIAKEKEDLWSSVLPIIDSIERAHKTNPAMEVILKFANKVLAEQGIMAIPAVSLLFDPKYHQALLSVETQDVPDQTIIEELQKGYMLKGKVIRPSMVTVARS